MNGGGGLVEVVRMEGWSGGMVSPEEMSGLDEVVWMTEVG